jgi:hypothetical protein
MSTTTVQLWCQAGEHYWDRPQKRGRRPEHCPAHKPAVEAAAKRPSPNQVAMQEGRERAARERREASLARIEAFRRWLIEDREWWASVRAAEICENPGLELARPGVCVIPESIDFDVAREEGLVA